METDSLNRPVRDQHSLHLICQAAHLVGGLGWCHDAKKVTKLLRLSETSVDSTTVDNLCLTTVIQWL